MKSKYNIKEIFKLAGTYISVCIGSGFATGQEIMQFFSAHGMISILSSTICMGIMAYCGASLLEIGNKRKLKSSNDIFTYLCGAVYDGEVLKKVQMAIVSVDMIEEILKVRWLRNEKSLDVLDVIEVVYRFSREVEHSEKNLKKMEHMMPIYHAKFC